MRNRTPTGWSSVGLLHSGIKTRIGNHTFRANRHRLKNKGLFRTRADAYQSLLAAHDEGLWCQKAKMPDEVQLELLAPWYTQNTSESRTLELFDAIPKYPFAVTTTIPKLERLEVPFTLRGQKYTALVAPARITDARTKEERLMYPGSREELVERALRFIAVQQIAKTKLTSDANWHARFTGLLYALHDQAPPRGDRARLQAQRH